MRIRYLTKSLTTQHARFISYTKKCFFDIIPNFEVKRQIAKSGAIKKAKYFLNSASSKFK